MSSSSEERTKDHSTQPPHQKQSQNHPQSAQNLKNTTTTNNSKSKSRSPQEQEEDSFFKDFYNRKRNRPKFSDRFIFNKGGSPGPGLFEQDSVLEDLRKQIEEERRKMFFDSADPFGNFPCHHHRGGSPGPNNAGPPGSSSPRMGRAGGGFPFESARSRLDDFPGARHPMFSTMRRPAWEEDPFGGNPFHRERHNSGSSGGASGSSTASTGEEHIIPIRIERSDGTSSPSNNTGSTNNAHAKAAAKANGSVQTMNPISTTPIPMPPPEGMSQSPTPESHHPQMQHIPGPQRSSTEVRKSPSPSPGERSPRAQSAPPDSINDATPAGKKFVSSINIEPQINPINSNSAPQPTQLGGRGSKEKTPPRTGGDGRPIPIFVEGRGPVINNNQRTNGPIPAPAPQQHHQSQDDQTPQQPKASRPAEPRDVTPPSKKPAPPKDPMEKIADITQDVKDLDVKIDEFVGNTRGKEYLLLDELLTRSLIKLDVIETEGREDVRIARKDCIKLIQGSIAKLESKVPLNKVDEGQSMEIDASGDHQTSPDSAMKEIPTAGVCGAGDANSSPNSSFPKPAAEVSSNNSTDTVKVSA